MGAKTEAHDAKRKDGFIQSYSLAATTSIFKGALVFINSAGFLYSNDGTINTLANWDKFAGVAVESADNSGWSDADIATRVDRTGSFILSITDAVTQANVWDAVLVNNVTDDAAVTITSDSGNPQATVWIILEVITSSLVRVAINGNVWNIAANGA